MRCGPVQRRGLQEARQWPDRSGPPGPGDRAIRPACTMPVIRLVHRCAGGSDRPGSGRSGPETGWLAPGAPAGPAGAPVPLIWSDVAQASTTRSSTVDRGRARVRAPLGPSVDRASSWSLDPCQRPSAQPAAGIVHLGATSDQDRGQARCRRSAPRPMCLGVSAPRRLTAAAAPTAWLASAAAPTRGGARRRDRRARR